MNDAFGQFGSSAAAHLQNEIASQWMKRGIALLEQNTRESLAAAVPCFEKAIQLRSALPLKTNSRFRYGLAAGWMNRGDALTRMGSSENVADALRSYDEALNQLTQLALDENPLYRRRLAVAHLNRGIAVLEQGDNFAEAVRSFDESVAILLHEKAVAISDREQLLGCAWMNRGNGLLRLAPPDYPHAYDAAKRALEFLAVTERSQLIAAEASLKARHVLCRAIGGLLAEPSKNKSDAKELAIEATNAIDDGMKLAREWEARGLKQFRPLMAELFRFGARAYQMHQPQFVVEFILESVDAREFPGASISGEMYAEAMQALWRSFREVQGDGFKKLNPAQSEEYLQKLSELSFAENRLNELQRE